MNTLHLGAMGVAIGGAGMLLVGALSLPSTAANVAKTVSNADKNQNTVMNYMDNQGNGNYVKHNQASMDEAWNYFNPSNYEGSGSTSSSTGSMTTSPGVNPGGPMSASAGSSSSTTTEEGSSDTDTTGTMPQVPSPLRRILMRDATHVLHVVKAHWRSNGTNPNWVPTGTNWQADWSNWNPVLWEQNGSTYANWSQQLGAYLSARFPGYATQIKQIGL